MIRRVKIVLAIFTLAFAIFGATSIATARPAHALAKTAASCSGVFWILDNEETYNIQGHGSNGITKTYTYFFSLSSLRNCSNGSYAGRVADEVCATVPAGTGDAVLNLYNQWYTGNSNNGFSYVSENITLFDPDIRESVQQCTWSGSWAVPSGQCGLAIGFLQSYGPAWPAGQNNNLEDCPN